MSKKGYYLNIEKIKLRDLKAKERAEVQAEHDWWAEREKILNKTNELDKSLYELEDGFDRINRIFWSAFLMLAVFAFIVGSL